MGYGSEQQWFEGYSDVILSSRLEFDCCCDCYESVVIMCTARSSLLVAQYSGMIDIVLTEHHRSGIYRHCRHPLSSVEPLSERRRSSRQTLPPPSVAGASATFFTPSLTSVTESDVCFLITCVVL